MARVLEMTIFPSCRCPAEAARLACGTCWTVYDPALGDACWQIPPGTPFLALPEHWI